jgi:hypothetical protein
VRTTVLAGVFLALSALGCSALAPNAGDIGHSISVEWSDSLVKATVSPWPLDDTVAFFCLRKPDGFSVEHRSPPAAAGCAPAGVTKDGDGLVASFDRASLDPAIAAAFAGQKDWYLAVAGSRGPLSFATTTSLLNPAPR